MPGKISSSWKSKLVQILRDLLKTFYKSILAEPTKDLDVQVRETAEGKRRLIWQGDGVEKIMS